MEQSYNRTMEKYQSKFDCSVQTKDYPLLKLETDKEYDVDYKVIKTFFFRIEYENFALDTSDGNQWFLAKSGDVGQFDKAISTNDKKKIRCRVFKQKFNYFDNPLNSSFMQIYKCYERDLSTYLLIDASLVDTKMFMIRDNDSMVFIPLL